MEDRRHVYGGYLPWRGIREDRVFKGGVAVPFTSTMDKKGPLREIKA